MSQTSRFLHFVEFCKQEQLDIILNSMYKPSKRQNTKRRSLSSKLWNIKRACKYYEDKELNITSIYYSRIRLPGSDSIALSLEAQVLERRFISTLSLRHLVTEFAELQCIEALIDDLLRISAATYGFSEKLDIVRPESSCKYIEPLPLPNALVNESLIMEGQMAIKFSLPTNEEVDQWFNATLKKSRPEDSSLSVLSVRSRPTTKSCRVTSHDYIGSFDFLKQGPNKLFDTYKRLPKGYRYLEDPLNAVLEKLPCDQQLKVFFATGSNRIKGCKRLLCICKSMLFQRIVLYQMFDESEAIKLKLAYQHCRWFHEPSHIPCKKEIEIGFNPRLVKCSSQ